MSVIVRLTLGPKSYSYSKAVEVVYMMSSTRRATDKRSRELRIFRPVSAGPLKVFSDAADVGRFKLDRWVLVFLNWFVVLFSLYE